mmetsp:Transcript_8295/g.23028  ORF Transcript_8295/g.23028 Transcript_8295/m.23028 type:complete len:273 (+) Transcript_8295:342-1160(+)
MEESSRGIVECRTNVKRVQRRLQTKATILQAARDSRHNNNDSNKSHGDGEEEESPEDSLAKECRQATKWALDLALEEAARDFWRANRRPMAMPVSPIRPRRKQDSKKRASRNEQDFASYQRPEKKTKSQETSRRTRRPHSSPPPTRPSTATRHVTMGSVSVLPPATRLGVPSSQRHERHHQVTFANPAPPQEARMAPTHHYPHHSHPHYQQYHHRPHRQHSYRQDYSYDPGVDFRPVDRHQRGGRQEAQPEHNEAVEEDEEQPGSPLIDLML